MSDQSTVTNRDAALILKVAACVKEHIFSNGDILPVISIKRRKQAEAFSHRLSDQFRKNPDDFLWFMVSKIQFCSEFLCTLRSNTLL